jgi:hypothetical protein
MRKASKSFRKSLFAFYCGDPSRNEPLDLTDDTVALFIKKAPNLQHVRIEGAPKVGTLTFHELMHLENIVSITLTTTRTQSDLIHDWALHHRISVLEKSRPATYNGLRYLELGGQRLQPDITECCEYYTDRSNSRSTLDSTGVEIVCIFGPSRLIAKTGTLSVREHGLHSYIRLVAKQFMYPVRSTLNENRNNTVVWRPTVRILGTDSRWHSDRA